MIRKAFVGRCRAGSLGWPVRLPLPCSTTDELTGRIDAILTDPRGFHIPPGKDKGCPLGEKLPLQYQYDIQVFAHEKFLMGGMGAEAIVREFDGRRKREGWTKCVLFFE